MEKSFKIIKYDQITKRTKMEYLKKNCNLCALFNKLLKFTSFDCFFHFIYPEAIVNENRPHMKMVLYELSCDKQPRNV